MMRMTSYKTELENAVFAKKAANHFAHNENHRTYGEGDPSPGGLLAIRWGAADDCVLVVRLDDGFEPINYQDIMSKGQSE